MMTNIDGNTCAIHAAFNKPLHRLIKAIVLVV